MKLSLLQNSVRKMDTECDIAFKQFLKCDLYYKVKSIYLFFQNYLLFERKIF